MKNTVLLDEQEALGADQLLTLTAQVYLKEALIAQEYEICRELVDTAKGLGVNPADITAVITDYLKTGGPGKQNRIRTYKEEQ